jgi:uncharacterized protein (TIGR00369 family)
MSLKSDTDTSTHDDVDHESVDVPEGFLPVKRGGHFFMTLAPVYRRDTGDSIVLGLRIAEHHGNSHGNAHGGMLVTLADGALYDNLMLGRPADRQLVTVNMSVDFISAARVGDWLEAHVHVHRRGQLLGFADCILSTAGRTVLRTSATFVQPPERAVAPS